MPFWIAILMFLLFSALSAVSFRQARGGKSTLRFISGTLFALLGATILLYVAVTLLFITSVD